MPIELLDLERIRQDIFDRLAAGVRDGSHPFRNAFVANVDEAGPDVRTVVLRRADATSGTVDFHTDIRSSKVPSLRRDGHVAWLFWDAIDKVQVRLRSTVTLHTDDVVATAAWNELSERTRSTYCTPLAPGHPIRSPERPTSMANGRNNFLVVRGRVLTMEWLHLHPEGHRRARFHDDTAMWVAP